MSLKKRLLNFFTALIMIFGSTPFVFDSAHAEASVGDEPGHGKTLIDNHDGTYTIALSVTGETDNESVTTTTKANVVLVVDTSNSMNQSSGTTSEYVYTEFTGNGTQGGQYWGTDGDGEYYSVYWRNNADPHWRTSNNNNGPVYSGTVYTRSGGTALSRIEAEKDALTKTNGIIDNLLKQNVPGDSVKSDIIEVSIVNFGTRGSVAQGWTTDATTLKDSINGLSTSTGTNWEEALSNAKTLADQKKASQPNEDVYIIFMTDGEPTTHSGSYNVNTNYASEWGQANDDARGIVSAGYKFYALFTWGSGNSSHYLSSLVQYAYTGSGNSNSTLSSDYEQYFTDASSTEILISALNQIVNDITTGVGYTNVEMTDGVTAMTGSSIKANANGEVTGLRYYRSGGSYSTTANNGLGDEWTDAPEATINSKGEVDWDLGTMVLEDGVTYTIAFTVWPKQESLDLVADLNNGKASYDDLSEDEKAQIIKNGDVYTLKTNTDYPTLTYSTTTTTTINGQTTTVVSDPTTIRIDNPDPVSLAEEKINIRKIWEDGLDDSQRADYGGNVILDFYRGNDVYQADITLNEDNDWELENYISIAPGIMVSSTSEAYQYADTYTADNEYAVLEEGHDYHFIEKNITNHFILNDSEYHPMLVDGVLKNVFYEKDSDGKIVINEIKDLTELTVTNTMKGGIDARKEVYRNEELDSEATDEFTITITIKNSEGGVYKNSDGTEAQYRIIYANGDRSEKRSATNGVVTETIVPGEIIRVQDLDPGAYYVVSEDTSNLPLGYDQEESGEAVYMIAKDGGEEEDFTDEETKTFDNETYYAVEGNASSKGILRNYYYTSELNLSKTVDVLNGNEDLIKDTEFTFNVNIYTDETKDEELTDLSQEVSLKDGEDVTIDNIPVGAYYEITEVDANSNGFTTESTNESGTIVKDETAESSFTNTYKVDSTETTISVKKNFGSFWHTDLTNPDLTDKFIFILKDENGEEIARQTVTETLKDNVQFTVPLALGDDEKITDEGKEFSFIITELTEGFRGGVSRVEGDEDIEITIVVTDNGDGTLAVSEPSYSKLEIVNTYSATGELTLEGIKELEGREFNDGESFTLILKDENGEVLLDEDGEQYTATATANGEVVSFDKPLKFTEEDIDETFTFYISEDETDLEERSITKTSDDAKVLVTVSDNFDGTLGFEVAYSNEKTITNKYSANGEISLSAIKQLEGRDWKEGETFEFTLSGDYLDEDLTATVSKDSQTATFDAISFTEEDIDKEFTFTISETSELPGGVTKSGDVTATVTIKDNGDGTLEVTADYDNNQTIVNTYTAESTSVALVANKEVSGRDWQDGETFTFGLYEDGELVEEVTVKKGESIEFSEIEYKEAGTYIYTIEETNTPDYFTASEPVEVTVEITDNQNGNLESEVSYADNNDTIVNTYSASGEATINITKSLVGRDWLEDETFEFTISGEGIEDETVAVSEDEQTVSFSPINYTLDDLGEHTYTISETSELPGGITKSDDIVVTVVVSDNFDGTLSAEISYTDDGTVTNTYEAEPTEFSFVVTKLLEGDITQENADTFYFELVDEEGEVVETIEIKGSGQASFSSIEKSEAGVYSYIIREVAGDTENYEYDTTVYQVTIEVYDDLDGHLVYDDPIIVILDENNEEIGEADDILFVNYYYEPGRGEVEEPEEENPYTYDNISLFVSLYIISLIGFAGSMVVSRKEA